jgi:zinc/manganese transport system permease protein
VLALGSFTAWLHGMFAQEFMRNAFLAGTGIALASGLVGYLVVLRNQVFTGDALSHVAFTGALAAFAAGVEPLIGLFGTSVLVAIGMGLLGGSARGRDVVVGVVFAWVLGLGVLFLSLYTTSRSSANGLVGINVLFGSIYGLSGRQATMAALIGLGVALVLAVVARPLLFASIDGDVAASRGVPVLSLGLMVTPAAAVQRVCTRPLAAFWLSALCTVLCLWLGLFIAYAANVVPSFAVIGLAFALYVATSLWRPLGRVMGGGRWPTELGAARSASPAVPRPAPGVRPRPRA